MTDDMLSIEEAEFQRQVRTFVEREIRPHALEWDERERYPRELFDELGRLGWLGTAFPESVGGSGGGSAMYAILCSELGRGSAGAALGI